jgi:hypothetical protein
MVGNTECRWRFSWECIDENGEQLDAAWETGCGQWCVRSVSTPQPDGFRNGFEFCPYCGCKLYVYKACAATA